MHNLHLVIFWPVVTVKYCFADSQIVQQVTFVVVYRKSDDLILDNANCDMDTDGEPWDLCSPFSRSRMSILTLCRPTSSFPKMDVWKSKDSCDQRVAFTPKSDQFHITPAASPQFLHHAI